MAQGSGTRSLDDADLRWRPGPREGVTRLPLWPIPDGLLAGPTLLGDAQGDGIPDVVMFQGLGEAHVHFGPLAPRATP